MDKNKLIILINRPTDIVFEFTSNPKNTHLWIPSIKEEIADIYPPTINTQYKNKDIFNNWNFYKVISFEKNKNFILSDLKNNYTVEYYYKKISNNQTQMIYYEWVKNGKLNNPFSLDILQNLKSILESK